MDVGITGLPEALNKEIKAIVDSSANAAEDLQLPFLGC
jgi:hypothetical protein